MSSVLTASSIAPIPILRMASCNISSSSWQKVGALVGDDVVGDSVSGVGAAVVGSGVGTGVVGMEVGDAEFVGATVGAETVGASVGQLSQSTKHISRTTRRPATTVWHATSGSSAYLEHSTGSGLLLHFSIGCLVGINVGDDDGEELG